VEIVLYEAGVSRDRTLSVYKEDTFRGGGTHPGEEACGHNVHRSLFTAMFNHPLLPDRLSRGWWHLAGHRRGHACELEAHPGLYWRPSVHALLRGRAPAGGFCFGQTPRQTSKKCPPGRKFYDAS